NNAAPASAEAMQQQVAQLAGLRSVASTLEWFLQHREELLNSQVELAQIPAPPFGESARSEWLRQRFVSAGLEDVHIDEIGNVLGTRWGTNPNAKFLALTAHVDTVFPAGTPVEVRRQGERVYGPGVSDNAAGVAALLALAEGMKAAQVETEAPLLFIGNVGEEGEGDVRGMRHIFATPKLRDAIAYTMVLDGAGTDTIITEALGSKRFVVTVRGPGGHSWSDFGVPNPIMVLSRALELFRRTHIPSSPKTTFNVGVISGGTSVNSIPESVSMRVDIRSVSSTEVDRLERALRDALDQAIKGESPYSGGRRNGNLQYEMNLIGSRPAARLKTDSRMLTAIRAVDSFLGNKARMQRASTDANIPISLGYEAFAIGAGGSGGGAHTVQEWFDAGGREFGLKRILLTALMLAGVRE
ncbi:MAG: M20/M25/M40 family metallo-hydrolase, partial [Candidatus Korobacteraceae bacterium]